MKTTRINMVDHTASIKVTREELAEIKYALFRLYEYYRDKGYDNLPEKAIKMWEELDKPFDKLYSDV